MKSYFHFIAILVLNTSPLYAALGDLKSLGAINQAVDNVSYQRFASHTVIETTEAHGLKIREFVNPANRVFGIAWEGPRLPDISQLLGSHFEEFKNASNTSTSPRGPLFKKSGNLVFFSGKYQRTFDGQAYLTHLLPADVSPDTIK